MPQSIAIASLNSKRRKKALKTTTTIIVIAAVGILCLVLFSGDWNLGGNQLNAYSGRVTLNVYSIKRVNGAVYTLDDADCEQWRLIHGSKDYNDKVASYSYDSVMTWVGEVKPEDNGIWYLVWDPGTNQTAWVDLQETLKQPYVAGIFGEDGDIDGFDELYLKLDLSGLSPLVAGESTKTVDLNLIACPARIATITQTNQMNSTGITGTYGYETTTGYFGGFSEGDLTYLAKIEIDFSNTGNSTYPDTDAWMLTHYQIGQYTFSASQFGGYDLANKRYTLKFGDQINFMSGGKPIYYAKNAGDLWCTYELKAYCAWTSAVIVPQIKLYFYDPDGTMTSAFIEYVMYTAA